MSKAKPLHTLTTNELAKFLATSTSRVNQLRKDGVIEPVLALGRCPFRFDAEETKRRVLEYRGKPASSLTTEEVKPQQRMPKRSNTRKGSREALWQR